MAHIIPGPLSQSNPWPGIALYNDSIVMAISVVIFHIFQGCNIGKLIKPSDIYINISPHPTWKKR